MNTEREAFEKCWDMEMARVQEGRHDTKEACWHMWQAALANKPEAEQYSELNLDVSIINEAADILYARLIEAPDIMREPIIDELHGIALGLPEKFAALQKRIEEFKAVISKKDEALYKLAKYPSTRDEELSASSIRRIANEALFTFKAGDVQAPKEGWIDYKVTSAGPVNDDVIVDVKFGDGTIRKGRAGDWNWQNNTLWRGNDIVAYRIAAAPTDTEGK